MSKWQKNAAVILCAVGILLAIGLGGTIVYSDYLYNPTGDFRVLQVTRSLDVPDSVLEETALSPLFLQMEAWAEKERATVLFKNGFCTGCGFVSHSGWLERVTGISPEQDAGIGIYIEESPEFSDAYVRGERFLPKLVDLEILGTYPSEGLPPVLEQADFLYPLRLAAMAEGLYYTDAEHSEELEKIFQRNGYISSCLQEKRMLSAGELLKRLLSDQFLSRSLLAALAGLTFCFVYSIFSLYEENARRLWIHHLFGMSRRWMLGGTLLLSAGMAFVASVLFACLLPYMDAYYMGEADRKRIIWMVWNWFFVLSLTANGAGYLWASMKWKRWGV